MAVGDFTQPVPSSTTDSSWLDYPTTTHHTTRLIYPSTLPLHALTPYLPIYSVVPSGSYSGFVILPPPLVGWGLDPLHPHLTHDLPPPPPVTPPTDVTGYPITVYRSLICYGYGPSPTTLPRTLYLTHGFCLFPTVIVPFPVSQFWLGFSPWTCWLDPSCCCC